MNKRDLLETFINLLPKANTLSGKPDEWGSIVIGSGQIDVPDYMFDFHVLYDESYDVVYKQSLKLYIYPVIDGQRIEDEKLIYNRTTNTIEVCKFTSEAIDVLIEQAKKHMYKDISNSVYQVAYWADENRGFFEHHDLGDQSSGELLFDKEKQLVDFDGTMCLPIEVAEALIENGNLTKKRSYDFTGQEPEKEICGKLSITLSNDNSTKIHESKDETFIIDGKMYYAINGKLYIAWNGKRHLDKKEVGDNEIIEIEVERENAIVTEQYVKDKNLTSEERDTIISNLVEANKKLIDLATYSNDISKILSDTIMKITK